MELFQITLSLTEENHEKELKGVVGAAKFLEVKEAILITLDEEGGFEEDGIYVRIVPVWRWLVKKY